MCAEQYALEAGLKRCSSRAGICPTRAGRFARDGPIPRSNAERHLFQALAERLLSVILQVDPYRMADCMPRPETLRGSLRNQGFAYEYAARPQTLAFLLTEAWLAPAASFRNRVTFTEVATRAMETCRKMISTGSADSWEVDAHQHSGAP